MTKTNGMNLIFTKKLIAIKLFVFGQFTTDNFCYEFRRKKVKLNNINELKVLDELNEEDWRKLTPYLNFE